VRSEALSRSLDLDRRLDARVGDEEVLPMPLRHDTSVPVQADQASPLGWCLFPAVGGLHQGRSAPREHPS
jgi:hypothetical protein